MAFCQQWRLSLTNTQMGFMAKCQHICIIRRKRTKFSLVSKIFKYLTLKNVTYSLYICTAVDGQPPFIGKSPYFGLGFVKSQPTDAFIL